MKELFFYNKPDQHQGTPQVLIVKLAEEYCGYAITNQTGTDLYSLSYCEMNGESSLALFEEKYSALKDTYYEVKIIFDFPYHLLLPFNEEAGSDAMSQLNNLHGNNSPSITVTENIPNWQLKNKYAVPAGVFDWVRKRFPSAKYLHQYSVSIMNLGAAGDEGKLLVDFSNQQFSVVAGKRNKFLLAKNFEYETPDDVLFYLLKTCEQFSLSPKEVSLELSGLIAKESSLYKELYQYFTNIGFRDAAWGSVDDHPAHFFISFNDIMRCAS
ncbi:MAG: DUF3822 family protein [Chitinophagaceae bacterium]|nr:DUF3822 family protein [Chitinophagaceae bacterium]